jgi:chemotaxis family two-component system response regulator Rcp1
MMKGLAPLVILLVEDDPADQKLIKTSLRNEKLANDLYIVQTGEEGLEFLHHCGNYGNGTPQPDLILLDLNMPGMGGKEFLRQVKQDEELKQIPIVILTTSDAERDIIDSYKLQASGYVHKPVTLEEFKEGMKKLKEYWFVLCKRIPRED